MSRQTSSNQRRIQPGIGVGDKHTLLKSFGHGQTTHVSEWCSLWAWERGGGASAPVNLMTEI